eukprot:jgi/Hompol1/6566/HPOL_001313-RA
MSSSSDPIVLKEAAAPSVPKSPSDQRFDVIELVRTATGTSIGGRTSRQQAGDAELKITFRTLSIQQTENRPKPRNAPRDPADAIREISVHMLRTQDVFTKYSTHPTLGLEKAAVARKTAGKNKISPVPTNYALQFATYLFGGFNFLLWIAGIVIILSWKPLGEPNPQAVNLYLAILIFLIIFISTGFYAVVDFSANSTMKSIVELMASSATVIRDGVQQDIPAADVVVGDVVVLSLGQRVPADLRLVSASPDLKFDRSLMTGESDPIAASIDPTDSNPLQSRNLAL